MKSFLAIKPKHKIAITLLTMILLLFGGVLLERHFLGKLNQNSVSIYADRLVPLNFVYQLSDDLYQRRLLISEKSYAPKEVDQLLQNFRKREDSILQAFEKTYLVQEEVQALTGLKQHFREYNSLENKVVYSATGKQLQTLDDKLAVIRQDLAALGNIQYRVGQRIHENNEELSSRAGLVSQVQVVVLLITCIITQGFILAAKSIIPRMTQKHNWN